MTLKPKNPAVLSGARVGSGVETDPPEFNRHNDDLQLLYVQLSERRRRSGDCVSVASCSVAEVEGSASPICSLARELLRRGVDAGTSLSIWRAGVKCFHDLPISAWAKITVVESSAGPAFRPYKPFSEWDAPSQARESGNG